MIDDVFFFEKQHAWKLILHSYNVTRIDTNESRHSFYVSKVSPKPRRFVPTCAFPEDVGEKVLNSRLWVEGRVPSYWVMDGRCSFWWKLCLNLCDYATRQNMIDRTWSNPFHQRKHANETCTSMHRWLNWCCAGFILWELTMAMEAIQHLQDPFTLVPSLAHQKALPDHSRPRRVPLDQIRHWVVSLLAPSNIWGTSFYQPPFFFQHHLCFPGGSRKCN